MLFYPVPSILLVGFSTDKIITINWLFYCSECGDYHSLKWYRNTHRVYVYSPFAQFSNAENSLMDRYLFCLGLLSSIIELHSLLIQNRLQVFNTSNIFLFCSYLCFMFCCRIAWSWSFSFFHRCLDLSQRSLGPDCPR